MANPARRSSRMFIAVAAMVAALAAGCARQPPPRMLLRPDVSAPLPAVPALGRPWQASQLLTMAARGQQDQLSVEVELQPGMLTLIAFTAWGSRVMTLRYDGRRIAAETAGQAPFLPPPPQILADVLLVNWPVHDWTLPRGWRLEQQPDLRRLWDAAGKLATEVRYPPAGSTRDIELINHAYGYRLGIRTLSGDTPIQR